MFEFPTIYPQLVVPVCDDSALSFFLSLSLSVCLSVCLSLSLSLSPSLTMWTPTGRSHLSSLLSGAKYAMHLALGFPSPLWPELLCFVCVTIALRYEYIITTNRTSCTYKRTTLCILKPTSTYLKLAFKRPKYSL